MTDNTNDKKTTVNDLDNSNEGKSTGDHDLNFQKKEGKKAQIVKKQKERAKIRKLAALLTLFAVVAIAAPIATSISFNNQVSSANEITVKDNETRIGEIEVTANFVDFVAIDLNPIIANLEEAQQAIDAQSINWNNWISANNLNGDFIDAIDHVLAATLVQDENNVNFVEFDIAWKDGFDITSQLIKEPFKSGLEFDVLEWKENAKEEIQKIVRKGEPYNNFAEIGNYLSITENQAIIKNLISESNTIKSMGFIIVEVPGHGETEKTYTITPSLLMSGDNAQDYVTPITGIHANINANIEWINYEQVTHFALNKIWEVNARNEQAILNVLNPLKNDFKALMKDGRAIIDFDFNVKFLDNVDFTISITNLTLIPGYVNIGTLAPLSQLSSLIVAPISWNEAVMKQKFNSYLAAFSFDNLAGINAKLNEVQFINEVKNLIVNSVALDNITLVAQGSSNNYTITTNLEWNINYRQVGELVPITRVNAKINAKLAWKPDARTIIENFLAMDHSRPFDSIAAFNQLINQPTGIMAVKGAIVNGERIQAMTIVATNFGPQTKFRIELKNIVMVPGWHLDTALPILENINRPLNMYVGFKTNFDDGKPQTAHSRLENLIRSVFYDARPSTIENVSNILNNSQSAINDGLYLFDTRSMLNGNHTIQRLQYDFTSHTNIAGTTYYRAQVSILMHDGYRANTTLTPADLLFDYFFLNQ